MVIYEKNITDIELEDINNLITEKQIENKYLEFKSQMTDGENDNLLKTVCGFANADGGLFIYGLKEQNGEASEITGVSLDGKSWDDKKRQIQDIIAGNIEPRLNVEINIIYLDNTDVIILIKVPKSWNPPHCVKNKKNRIFFIRRDGRTDPMEYEELRRMFDLNNSLIEKINNFRNGRIVKYESENPEYYKVIFHAVPLNAFSNNSINLEKAKNELTYGKLIARNYIYNFDGLYNNSEEYLQLFRNGTFERCYTIPYKDERMYLATYEEEYITFCKEILHLYKKLDIVCPVVFFVSLTNIEGYNLYNRGIIRTYGSLPDKRQKLDPSGIIINNENEIEKKVKDLFQPLWNHYGLPENNTR